jgi:hypothetical protein
MKKGNGVYESGTGNFYLGVPRCTHIHSHAIGSGYPCPSGQAGVTNPATHSAYASCQRGAFHFYPSRGCGTSFSPLSKRY